MLERFVLGTTVALFGPQLLLQASKLPDSSTAADGLGPSSLTVPVSRHLAPGTTCGSPSSAPHSARRALHNTLSGSLAREYKELYREACAKEVSQYRLGRQRGNLCNPRSARAEPAPLAWRIDHSCPLALHGTPLGLQFGRLQHGSFIPRRTRAIPSELAS